MTETIAGRTRGGTLPSTEALDALRAELRGVLCLPGEPGYDEARTIWNAMIDRRPGAIVRAAGAADVVRAVRFARDHDLLLSVRGGGHNIAGNAVADGGLMIDLTRMKSVRIDPVRRTAWVEPGVTLGEFDKEAQTFALATPLGINSTTGVAGLTLGGGFGWLSRKHGLSVDNLLGADVVTANGELVHASETENPDLFWAIRGGGGNFGVVTSFEFRLVPVGPLVHAGLIIHPLARAKAALEAYAKAMPSAPEDLTVWIVMRKAPPLPFLDPRYHGTEILAFAVCYHGEPEKADQALGLVRSIGQPIAEFLGPMPFVAWQQIIDPLLAPGARNYWKSHNFKALTSGMMDVMIEFANRLPSPECELAFAQLGGAINRVPADATAYPHRDIAYLLNIHTRWTDASRDQACIAWARELYDRMAPHATGSIYVNFIPEDESQRLVASAYGSNFARLAKLKTKYDPTNLFQRNSNIQPA